MTKVTNEKEEFPSLIPSGINDIAFDELESQFVDIFPKPGRRKELFDKLALFIKELQSFNVEFEILVDGSFTTEKPEPDDVDIVISLNDNDANNLPNSKQEELGRLVDNDSCKIRYNCDVYIYPQSDRVMRDYWHSFYGTYRDAKTPKGIVRLVF